MTILELLELIAQGIEPPKNIKLGIEKFVYEKVDDNHYDYVSIYNPYVFLSEYIYFNKESLNQCIIILADK